MNPEYSEEDDRYRRKSSNIFCFPKEEKIKNGDFIFIFNNTKKGKINKGFIKHYRANCKCSLNNKHKVFKDPLLHKYFITFDIEYVYNESFNMIKFKDNFNEDTPNVKTPAIFNKLYTRENIFNFKELPKELGIFILNLILRRIKKIDIKKDYNKSQKKEETEEDETEEDETEETEEDETEETDEDEETEEDETEETEDEMDSIDHFRDNKKLNGYMIPVLIEICEIIHNKMNKIIKNKKDIKEKYFMEHYLDCINCNTIDNNNIGLKYSYFKCKDKKEIFKLVKFDEIEEEFESYQGMNSHNFNKKTVKTIFNINFIKDAGSEYNNYILISWWLN
jgi:hypothetical protein